MLGINSCVSPLTMRVRVRFWYSPCSLICTRTVYFPASSSATSFMTREVPLMRYLEQCSAAKFPSLNLLRKKDLSSKCEGGRSSAFQSLCHGYKSSRGLGEEVLSDQNKSKHTNNLVCDLEQRVTSYQKTSGTGNARTLGEIL